MHALKTLEHPRWEDFEYERSDDFKNRLYWLGDGRTSDEKSEDGNSEFAESCRERSYKVCDALLGAWYLGEEYIDRPPGELEPVIIRAQRLADALYFQL